MNDIARPYPAALDRQPRVVRWKEWYERFRVLLLRFIGFMLVSIGLALMLWGLTWALLGTDQEGTVTAVSTEHGENGSVRYLVQYKYIRDGVTRHDSAAVNRTEYNYLCHALGHPEAQAHPALLFPVRSLKIGPWISVHRADSGWGGSPLGPVALFIVSVFVAVVPLLYGFIIPWSEQRLYERGLPATGAITDKETVRKGQSKFWLGYRFNTPDGQERAGWCAVAKCRWEKAGIGERVTVLYYQDSGPTDLWATAVYEYGRFVCV